MNDPTPPLNMPLPEKERLSLLRASGVTKTFRDSHLDVAVLDGIDFEVTSGQTIAIVGASGSGKSTLLHLLGGLDATTSGQVMCMGRAWVGMNEADKAQWRNRCLGFVYQFHHLLLDFSALDNVAMPLFIRRMNRQQARAQAAKLLAEVGLEQRIQHRPVELSGGERQRVAIARALVSGAPCVLADEPTGNLDGRTATKVFDLMLRLAKEKGTGFVLATHDELLAQRCDQRWQLSGGKLLRLD